MHRTYHVRCRRHVRTGVQVDSMGDPSTDGEWKILHGFLLSGGGNGRKPLIKLILRMPTHHELHFYAIEMLPLHQASCEGAEELVLRLSRRVVSSQNGMPGQTVTGPKALQ